MLLPFRYIVGYVMGQFLSCMQPGFINGPYKVKAVGQWVKIMITVMGFAHRYGGALYWTYVSK